MADPQKDPNLPGPAPKAKRDMLRACLLSFVLIVLIELIQLSKPSALEIKPQWLWIAVLPILVTLITGRYFSKLTVGTFFTYESDPQIRALPLVAPQTPTGTESSAKGSEGSATSAAVLPPAASWTERRALKYQENDNYFLVHVCEPSASSYQGYDITVFLVRHGSSPYQRDGFWEVEKLELYLGPYWNDAIFTSANNGGLIGIRTSAWGTFLATGRLTFKDGRPPLILHRYVDFEMAAKRTSTP